MRNQRSFYDPLDYKLVIQPGSEEYKAYISSLRRAANESKRVNRFLHDENIEKIARYFALKKHVPSKQEALNYIAVYKTPYNLYAKLCKIANVASFVGFLLCVLIAVLIPPSWVDAFSVFYSLFLYVVVTNFMLRYFMGLKFRSASFAAVVLTKHYLGIVDLNGKK